MALSDIFDAVTKSFSGEKPLKVRAKRRAYFLVTGEAEQKALRNWAEQRREAGEAIGTYLKSSLALQLIGEVPNYKIGDDGYVESISFVYGMPMFTHDGWTGIPNTNWLVPDNAEVETALKSLPAMPAVEEVNEMIGWPQATIDNFFRDMHIRGYKEFAKTANNQTNVFMTGEHVLISVPFPQSFSDYPALAEQIEQWEPPEFLEQIDEKSGKKLERQDKFLQSPLARTIEKTANGVRSIGRTFGL